MRRTVLAVLAAAALFVFVTPAQKAAAITAASPAAIGAPAAATTPIEQVGFYGWHPHRYWHWHHHRYWAWWHPRPYWAWRRHVYLGPYWYPRVYWGWPAIYIGPRPWWGFGWRHRYWHRWW